MSTIVLTSMLSRPVFDAVREHVPSLTSDHPLRVIYIPTALHSTGSCERTKLGDLFRDTTKWDPLCVDITGLDDASIREKFNNCEAIFIGGGNTFFLMQQVQKSGLGQVLRQKLLEPNFILVGESAGSIITNPDIGHANVYGDRNWVHLEDTSGLSLVNYYTFPHNNIATHLLTDWYIASRHLDSKAVVRVGNNEFIVITDGLGTLHNALRPGGMSQKIPTPRSLIRHSA